MQLLGGNRAVCLEEKLELLGDFGASRVSEHPEGAREFMGDIGGLFALLVGELSGHGRVGRR